MKKKNAKKAGKLKVAIFSFTCCEGCEVEMLNIGSDLFDVIDKVDIINAKLLKEKNDKGPFDIAFVQGAISTTDEITEIKKLRKNSKFIVALGACACLGGVPAMRNFFAQKEVQKIITAGKSFKKSVDAVPIDHYIPVDYYLRGCPMAKQEFIDFLRSMLAGKINFHKEFPVCIECRQRGNPCLLVQGKVCFGPLAHAGCNAPCPSAGAPCEACRGILDDANIDSIVELLEKHGVSLSEIKRRLGRFASMEERFKEVKLFHQRLK